MSTINCADLVGNNYEYTLLPFEVAWNAVSGIYIFVAWDPGRGWVPLYIGQAESLKDRICASHECWAQAEGLGATHVLARCVPDASTRATEERRLIEAYNPPLNVQHRSYLSGA